MSRASKKPRYQTVRYNDTGEYPTTDHAAQFVRVVAPDGKSWVDVAWVGGNARSNGAFEIMASDLMVIEPDVSNRVFVAVRRYTPPRKTKNVARKG